MTKIQSTPCHQVGHAPNREMPSQRDFQRRTEKEEENNVFTVIRGEVYSHTHTQESITVKPTCGYNKASNVTGVLHHGREGPGGNGMEDGYGRKQGACQWTRRM